MWCTRFRFLFLVLVIYLVSLGDSIASAHSVVGMIEKNDDDAKGAKKVGPEITVAHRLPKITPKKSFGSTTKVNDKTSRSNSALWSRPTTTIKKSTKGHSAETLKPKAAEPFYQGSHDPFHRIGAKRPADAVAEMFNMLHKDYYTRSRRKPPINNSMPLKDPHVKP
ncbi:hypothetical protein OPV22_012959 [Ensete ventricosum]|uniref:Uncharacterized protein n=1 Tax=Ensete ventricosum TaxID=4639 RepID=A0AAV8QZY2_ENSVE|nr:hypothetical protein OPV22_012959 [Ensete ventricosum]